MQTHIGSSANPPTRCTKHKLSTSQKAPTTFFMQPMISASSWIFGSDSDTTTVSRSDRPSLVRPSVRLQTQLSDSPFRARPPAAPQRSNLSNLNLQESNEPLMHSHRLSIAISFIAYHGLSMRNKDIPDPRITHVCT
jgi:hypothetical protein